MEAKSIDGERFEKLVDLHMNTKSCSVFVQTNKSIYKPSDKIQFRVLLWDDDLRPFESSKVEVYVTDGAWNEVKQFESPKFVKGVFQDELQLSDAPVNWTIHVKVEEESDEITKQFEVAEYVLPQFEVIVDAKPHVAFSDDKIRVTVSGKDTFGKLAKGKATVTATVTKNHFSYRSPLKVAKIVDVDGKNDVEFDIKEELELRTINNAVTVDIEATFTEQLSGREHSASKTVTIHTTPHEIELRQSSDKIKPGLPFTVTAIVKFLDGSPDVDDENPVEFNVIYFHANKLKKRKTGPDTYTYQLCSEHRIKKCLVNGTAVLDIDVPRDVKQIEVDAKYLDTEGCTPRIAKVKSSSSQFVQAKILTEK